MNKLTKSVVSFVLKYPLYFMLFGGIQCFLGIGPLLSILIGVGVVLLFVAGQYVNGDLKE